MAGESSQGPGVWPCTESVSGDDNTANERQDCVCVCTCPTAPQPVTHQCIDRLLLAHQPLTWNTHETSPPALTCSGSRSHVCHLGMRIGGRHLLYT